MAGQRLKPVHKFCRTEVVAKGNQRRAHEAEINARFSAQNQPRAQASGRARTNRGCREASNCGLWIVDCGFLEKTNPCNPWTAIRGLSRIGCYGGVFSPDEARQKEDVSNQVENGMLTAER